MNDTISVGVIVLGAQMDDEILMVENDGLYSLPEISIDASEYNNIIDIAYDLTKQMGIKANMLNLAYALEQRIPDSDEVIVTYYFVTMVDDNNVAEGYKWVSKSYDKIDSAIYPDEFRENLKNKLTNGWQVIAEVIK